MTSPTTGPIEVSRLKKAWAFDKCALVPGHMITRGSQIGWATPLDPAAEPIGWVCSTCKNRIESGIKTVEELTTPALRRGDHVVVWAGVSGFPARCALHYVHRRAKGDPTGLVVQLMGEAPFELVKDKHIVLGFCCSMCLMRLISR